MKSSVPASVRLTSLGYLKGRDPPITKEVHEYPAWLWTLLDKKEGEKADGTSEGGEEGDAYCECLQRNGAFELALN